MRAAIVAVAATAMAMTGGAFGIWGSRIAIGVAIGGALATVNLIVLARIGQAFIGRKGRTSPWAVIAAFKLVALLAGVWLILKSGVASGLTLAMGYCALPIGITLGSLFGPKPPEPGETPPRGSTSGTAADPSGNPTPSNDSHRDVLEAGRREAQAPSAGSR
jgi:hypothetical protein